MIDFAGLLVGFCVMLGLMALGLHVGTVMLAMGVGGLLLFYGPVPLRGLGNQLWSMMNDFLLTSIPLFVLLGELLMRSGVTKRMYDALSHFVRWIPGGLLHSNIASSALFASVSGSSVATAATISTIALPEFEARRYNEKFVLGSIAAGATLGILIPPSINLIIYGAMTNTSIGELFVAAVAPGLLLAVTFMLGIAIIAFLVPGIAPAETDSLPWREKIGSLIHLTSPLVIFGFTMASITYGWATPSEAAGIGVVVAFFTAAAYGGLSLSMLQETFTSTLRTTALCVYILVGALILNFVVGLLGVAEMSSNLLKGLDISRLELILLLLIFYFILGCFFDSMAMIVGTIPIVFPIVSAAGIDPVWFGIFLVLMAELALVTPPVGMNIYVIQGIRGRGSIMDAFIGVAPFVFILVSFVGLIIAFPEIVTFTRPVK